jgi:hypothetical protein
MQVVDARNRLSAIANDDIAFTPLCAGRQDEALSQSWW